MENRESTRLGDRNERVTIGGVRKPTRRWWWRRRSKRNRLSEIEGRRTVYGGWGYWDSQRYGPHFLEDCLSLSLSLQESEILNFLLFGDFQWLVKTARKCETVWPCVRKEKLPNLFTRVLGFTCSVFEPFSLLLQFTL